MLVRTLGEKLAFNSEIGPVNCRKRSEIDSYTWSSIGSEGGTIFWLVVVT
jgi:hypothetical protein